MKLVLLTALLAVGTVAPAHIAKSNQVAHPRRVHAASTDQSADYDRPIPASYHAPGVRCTILNYDAWKAGKIKKTNQPPSVTLSVVGGNTPHKVGVPVRLRAIARDRDGDWLAYTWVTSGGELGGVSIAPSAPVGPNVAWSGGEAGDYTVNVSVDDQHGCMASKDVTFTVVK